MNASASYAISRYYLTSQRAELGVNAVKPKPCKTCGSTFHSAWYHKPRTAMKVTKPMNKIGRIGKRTNNAMAKWERETPTNHQGYMVCYLCGAWVTYKMPDHVRSRARAPELRADQKNLKPICAPCNEKKQSKDVHEL